MTKTLIAATMIAALGGFVVTSAAYADASNGAAQRSIASANTSRNTAPIASTAASSVMTVAPPAADTGTYLSRSHGRP